MDACNSVDSVSGPKDKTKHEDDSKAPKKRVTGPNAVSAGKPGQDIDGG